MLYNYNLTHLRCVLGKMGRLTGITTMQVIAGDKIGLSLDGLFRMSPTRKPLWFPAYLDTYAYFVPWRYIFGNDTWIEYIKSQGASGLPYTGNFHVDRTDFSKFTEILGFNTNYIQGGLLQGYCDIRNNYFKDPNYHSDILPSDYYGAAVTDTDVASILGSAESAEWGLPMCNMQTMHTTPIINALPDSAFSFSTDSDDADIRDIALLQTQVKQELDENVYSPRFYDLMERVFKAKQSTELDHRPQFLGHNRQLMGGHDIDGTAGDNQGQTTGKSTGRVKFGFKEQYFRDHGFIMVMAGVRFPPIFKNQAHPGMRNALESPLGGSSANDKQYLNLIADPRISASIPYGDHYSFRDMFSNGANTANHTAFGNYPALQHLREHSSSVHPRFHDVDAGFPFQDVPSHIGEAIICDTEAWDEEVFLSTALAHFSMQLEVKVNADRMVPPASRSVNVGTSL